jgi:hypothetical protein
MEHWWNGTDRGVWSIGGTVLTGGTEVLGEKNCPRAKSENESYHELYVNIRFVPLSKHITVQVKNIGLKLYREIIDVRYKFLATVLLKFPLLCDPLLSGE